MNPQQMLIEIAPLLSRSHDLPIYQQITMHIRKRIEQGELVPGQLLPPLAELAQLLAVGQMTVRKALEELASQNLVQTRHGSGTRVANPHAPQHQTSSTTQPIHIVFAQEDDGYPFLPLIKQHFKNALRKFDQTIDDRAFEFTSLSIKEDDETRIASRIDLSKVRGIVFNSPLNMTLLSMCIRRGLPYVLLFNELADGNSPCVMKDYGPGLNAALSQLADQRRKRVVLLTPDAQRFATGRLSEMFCSLLDAHGFANDEESVITAGYHQQQGFEVTEQLLQSDRKPDAIVYSSDYQALGGLHAAEKAGVHIPTDLAIIGMGNLLDADDWPQRVSTLDMHMDMFCSHAIKALLANTSQPLLRFAVKSTYLPGQTT